MTSTLTLKDVAERMRDLDICMLTTRAEDGRLESRPMSNNKDVDYNGDSWFFTMADTRTVADIQREPNVCMAYDGRSGLFSKHTYISIAGTAEIIRDKAAFKAHWAPDLEAWFKDGIDTPGLALIHVKGSHVRYWHGFEEGEFDLGAHAKAA